MSATNNVVPSKIEDQTLSSFMEAQATKVTAMLNSISAMGDAVSVGSMFKMQMAMNHFSQASEMCTALFSGMNSLCVTMAKALNR